MQTKYRWREWFRVKVVTLREGVHYDYAASFYSQLRNAASRLGYKIRVEAGDDSFTVRSTKKKAKRAKK